MSAASNPAAHRADARGSAVMPDKFTSMPPKVVRFLLVALDPGKTDSEREIAIREFAQYLTSIGSGGYELVERIKTEPVSDEDLQRMCDVAIERDRAAQRHNTPVVATGPLFGSGPGSVGTPMPNARLRTG